MKKEINYQEIFKATFEPEKLKELIDRWDSDDKEIKQNFTVEEIKEIMRYEGRKRIENIEDAKRLEKEIKKFNKKFNSNK